MRPSLLVVAAFAAASPVLAADSGFDAQEGSARPHLVAHVGTAAGSRLTAGGVGLGTIALSYTLLPWLQPDIVVGIGGHALLDPTSEPQVVDRFSIGTRVVAPFEGLAPFLWLALHHEHQAAWSTVMREPFGAVLGFSVDGVDHFTGAEAGLGVGLPFVVDRQPLDGTLRVAATWLPGLASHAGAADQVGVMVDLSVGIPVGL